MPIVNLPNNIFSRFSCFNVSIISAFFPGADRLRLEHQHFETPSKRKIEIITIASNYHIEV